MRILLRILAFVVIILQPAYSFGYLDKNIITQTPTLEVTPTHENLTNNVVVSGSVQNGSGSNLKGPIDATLVLYDTLEEQIYYTESSVIGSDGMYLFSDLSLTNNSALWIMVEYQDVSYYSDYVVVDQSLTNIDLTTVVYDATTNWQELDINLVHIVISVDSETLTIQEYFGVSNESLSTVTIETDGSRLPFIELPVGFDDFDSLTPDSSSASFLSYIGGIALPPEPSKQYGVIVVMSAPYNNQFEFAQNFPIAVAELTLVVPDGINIKSNQLTEAGAEVFNNVLYHLFNLENISSGYLQFTISGKSTSASSTEDRNSSLIIISIGILGVIFILLGVTLFIRENIRNKRLLSSQHIGYVGTDSLSGENPDEIADAVIQLDEIYKSGDISKGEYEKMRADLKHRLKESLKKENG